MGSLEKRLGRLEERTGIPYTEASEAREEEKRMSETRARVIAELNGLERRVRGMSEAEREAWRNDPRRQAELREIEEQIERRRRGGA